MTNEWRPISARSEPRLAELAVRLARTAGGEGEPEPAEWLAAFARFAGAARATGTAETLARLVAEKHASDVKAAALEALEAMAAPNLVATVRGALGDVDGAVRASAL